MSKKDIHTTVNKKIVQEAKILAIKLEVNLNQLIEEGLEMVIDKYEKELAEKEQE
ncbi:ribbon-helix-helix domain-containing protein [Natroniella sulfidigena]|uniref:ribbon-helix-helix domain-containing protein n=1 Tax=Natroniella sulfidigena TaxID=723921 RepID=UPI00200B5C99|nr:ribbon-helix-helix domain-containing protein [Natroniella sulfidigena]